MARKKKTATKKKRQAKNLGGAPFRAAEPMKCRLLGVTFPPSARTLEHYVRSRVMGLGFNDSDTLRRAYIRTLLELAVCDKKRVEELVKPGEEFLQSKGMWSARKILAALRKAVRA